MIFLDANGDALQCTIFPNDVAVFIGRLQEGLVYCLARVNVIPTDDKFRVVPNIYQLTLNEKTEVLEATTELDQFSRDYYSLVGLHEINSFLYNSDRVIDVMGIVVFVSTTQIIPDENPANQPSVKRDVFIMDQSCIVVRLTLWDHYAHDIGDQLRDELENNIVLLSCGLHVNDFNGTYLSTGRFSRLCVKPDDSTAINLVKWYRSDDFARNKVKWIRNCGLPLHCSLWVTNAMRVKISNMCPMPKVNLFRMVAKIVDVDLQSFYWYDACSICYKEVNYIRKKTACYNCGKPNVKATVGVMVNITVKDSSGTMTLRLRNKQVEFVFQSSGSELKELNKQHNGQNFLQQKCDSYLTKRYVFVLRPPRGPFISNAIYKVTYVIRVNWVEECAYILRRRMVT